MFYFGDFILRGIFIYDLSFNGLKDIFLVAEYFWLSNFDYSSSRRYFTLSFIISSLDYSTVLIFNLLFFFWSLSYEKSCTVTRDYYPTRIGSSDECFILKCCLHHLWIVMIDSIILRIFFLSKYCLNALCMTIAAKPSFLDL